MAFAGIVTAFVCIIGSLMPELERIAVLSYVGLACVLAANWTLTIAIVVKGRGASRPPGRGNEIVAANVLPFYKAINAVATQLFALMGTPSFFTMSAEMERPEDFLRSVYAGQGLVVGTYVVIACLVYARAGHWIASPVLASAGPTFKIACYATALFGLFITCLLTTNLGAKYIFVRLLRGTPHLVAKTKTHWIVWTACFCGFLIIGFILACAIPVFGDLVSLIGALTGGFLLVSLTGIMALYTLSLEYASETSPTGVVVPKGRTWIQRSFNRTWHGGRIRDKANWILGVVLVFAGAFMTVAGTYGSAVQIADDAKSPDASHAFSCTDNSV